MQSKTPLLMVTALVCGLGAAFGTWKLVSGATNAPADEAKVKVLVPVADVAPYFMFQDEKRFTEMEWPKSRLREGEEETIKSFDQIKGKTSRHYKLKPNEPIYKNDICDNIENDVSERLLNGEVAHAVQVSADRAGGGFVQVGDRLNIETTVQPSNAEPVSRTFFFLEDIEVLAVDNQAQKAMNTMATPPTRFLLRVTMAQSLVLKHYQDTSRVDFVKRKTGDKTKVGESMMYIPGKKTSSIPGYAEDVPEGTVAVNLDTATLKDPVDDASKPKDNSAKIDQSQLTETEEERLRKRHEVTINVNGTVVKQPTNATYDEIVKKQKGLANKDDGKKDEGKKDDGKKDETKTPGQ